MFASICVCVCVFADVVNSQEIKANLCGSPNRWTSRASFRTSASLQRRLYITKTFALCWTNEQCRTHCHNLSALLVRAQHAHSGLTTPPAGLISPWNLPLYLLSWKLAPALATGNCVVCKPSEFTSLTAHMLCEVANEAGVPKGTSRTLWCSHSLASRCAQYGVRTRCDGGQRTRQAPARAVDLVHWRCVICCVTCVCMLKLTCVSPFHRHSDGAQHRARRGADVQEGVARVGRQGTRVGV
jgi:hypothetical protein